MRRVLVAGVLFLVFLLVIALLWKPREGNGVRESGTGGQAPETGESSRATRSLGTNRTEGTDVKPGTDITTNGARADTLRTGVKVPAQAEVRVAPMPELTGMAPQTVMENMRSVFREYATRFKGNPVGTNPEITAALNGGNPGQAQFLREEDGLRVNERGELVDFWGVPFFFHQLSANEMEIHSAGPDRVMWTPDDLVMK